MNTVKTAALLISISTLAACAAQPKALYQVPPKHGEMNEGDWEGLTKFTLAKSQLVIDYKDKDKSQAHMLSLPAEAESSDGINTRFMLRPASAWGVNTHLKVTKIENTELLASVGTETEDKRIKLLESAGALAVNIISFGITDKGTDTTSLPISIDSYALMRSGDVERDAKDNIAATASFNDTDNNTVHFTASFSAIPDDAIDNQVFTNKAGSLAQETIFYSACRTVSIHFESGPLEGQQFSATIADPRYVQTLKFPEKGAINFHSICGANTTSSASGSSNQLDVLSALITQYKTVQKAWATQLQSKQ